MKIATESGHWYDAATGEPRYTIVGTNGEVRNTTLRDARKFGYVPSVTTILKCAAQPGLIRWMQQQILHAALTLPRIDGETEEDYAERVIEDSQEQSRKAREKGTEIHGSIELGLSGMEYPFEHERHVNAVIEALSSQGLSSNSRTEHSFASPMGYGGKVDFHGSSFVCDFKTKGNWQDDKKLAYSEHLMQLVAYARGLNIQAPRLLNIFISTDEPGKIAVHEWSADEHERHWEMFLALLNFWKLSNKVQ
jgi:hypothetical protein